MDCLISSKSTLLKFTKVSYLVGSNYELELLCGCLMPTMLYVIDTLKS